MKPFTFPLLATGLILCCGCGRSSAPKEIVIGEPIRVTDLNGGVRITGQGRKVELKEEEHGIAITVMETKDGTNVENLYKVKDPEELAKSNPEAYKLYKDAQVNLDWRRHFKVINEGGCAGLQFDRWVLVFEAIPAQSVPTGLSTFDDLPRARADFMAVRNGLPVNGKRAGQIQIHGEQWTGGGGPGRIQASIGDLRVSSWGGNSMSVNGCRFEFTEGGKNLVFADHTYEAAETARRIVISKDGKTREQANK
jgi:hypothetical protein